MLFSWCLSAHIIPSGSVFSLHSFPTINLDHGLFSRPDSLYSSGVGQRTLGWP